jgi:imidazolonepropionase-like amidohydrolase
MRPRLLCAALALAAVPLAAQRPTLSTAVKQFVTLDTSVFAIRGVRVIDGTGAPAKADQTIIVREGKIAEIGDASRISIPAGVKTIDGAGRSLLPGMVMVHEHFFYPTGPGVYGNLAESFSRLYLAGGVTALRTGGNMNGFGDIAIAKAVADGNKPGPWIDATAPYVNGPGLGLGQVYALKDVADARRHVNYWADMGATSFKVYMQISREALKATIEEAHKRNLKVTGHICSITYREAAALGIDNLEHGFFASTDFVKDKQPDLCPGQGAGQATIAALDENSAEFKALVADLIKARVALTSTLTVFEAGAAGAAGRPLPPGTEVLVDSLRRQYEQRHANATRNPNAANVRLLQNAMKLEAAFHRAGGTLVAGTDPTGGGGVIPGYSNQHQVELMVESGISPLDAIRISTLNGANYLGIGARTGSIAVGKQADLMLVMGDPSANIADIRKVEMVFKQGVGWDSQKLIGSVKGRVGIF